jgi:hypothetical protein
LTDAEQMDRADATGRERVTGPSGERTVGDDQRRCHPTRTASARPAASSVSRLSKRPRNSGMVRRRARVPGDIPSAEETIMIVTTYPVRVDTRLDAVGMPLVDMPPIDESSSSAGS